VPAIQATSDQEKSVGSERLVSIVRGRADLEVVISREEREGEKLRFTLETRALRAVPAGVCPQGRRVETAWAALRASRRVDAETLAHAAVVLLETVGAPGQRDRNLSPLRMPSRALFAETAEVTAGRLGRLGYDAGRVRAALSAVDPALAFHHGQAAAAGRLPALFVSQVLPLLRGLPWTAVRTALAVFWALALERDDRLRAAIVRLLAIAGGDRGLRWCMLAQRLAPPQQLDFVTALVDTEACTVDPVGIDPAAVDELAVLATQDSAGACVPSFAAGIRSGMPLSFLMPSLRIAQVYAPASRFRGGGGLPDCRVLRRLPPDAEDVINALLAHVEEPMTREWGNHFAIGLWRCCGVLEGLVDVLRRPVFRAAAPETSFALVRFLVAPFYYEDTPDREEWREVRREFAQLESRLASVPVSHQAKFVSLLESVLSTWVDPEKRAVLLPLGRAVARRLSGPPFRLDACTSGCLGPLVEAAELHADRFLSAPDASLKRLETACRVDNRRALMTHGLQGLAARFPSLVIESFVRHPEALFRAAVLLGSLGRPRRDALLRRFRAHPVFGRRFVQRPLFELCALLDAWRAPGQTSPVPRKLRQHLETGHALSVASLEGHRQTIARRLVLVKLDLLRQAVLRELSTGLPSGLREDERGRHALMMLGSLDTNRRLLRRLLVEYAKGRPDSAEEHEASRQWYARHPRLDPQVWREGITREQDVPGLGRVRLAIERDLLEALKLGTYVGSCLSAGGVCDYSAVSVVADVNKRVVYARRGDGAVVGRQVVAITEDDRLACFPVYPLAARAEIKQAFQEFDQALAQALGLGVFVGEECEVALILAQGWWDDGVWDLS
jgi:hypothetical protein